MIFYSVDEGQYHICPTPILTCAASASGYVSMMFHMDKAVPIKENKVNGEINREVKRNEIEHLQCVHE